MRYYDTLFDINSILFYNSSLLVWKPGTNYKNASTVNVFESKLKTYLFKNEFENQK